MANMLLSSRNAAPQQLVNIILDTSGSMHGDPIEQVLRGARKFKADCCGDVILRERLQVAFITFGGDVHVREFVPIPEFEPPVLSAGGVTPLAEAILAAIAAADEQADTMRRVAELDVYKPMHFLLSDGAASSPPHSMQLAAQKIRECEHAGRGAFYGFGIDAASVRGLQPLFSRQVELLQGVDTFTKFFDIISASVFCVSRRCVGEEPDLRPIIQGFLRGPKDARQR